MATGSYRPHLAALVDDAQDLMWALSDDKGYFTNLQFIRRTAQRHQGTYVQLLKVVLDERGEQYLFNIAHEQIGARLARVAEQAGYEKDRESGVTDWNVWGDEQQAVIYRRTDRVAPRG